MKIYLVGNPLVKEDSLPFKLLPKLRKEFPSMVFEEADPNENFIPEDSSIIVDTVVGLDAPQVFTSLEQFQQVRSVTTHDFDLLLHLQLLTKLQKLERVKIIGIPAMEGKKVFRSFCQLLKSI